jgi:hypothetical protein
MACQIHDPIALFLDDTLGHTQLLPPRHHQAPSMTTRSLVPVHSAAVIGHASTAAGADADGKIG